MCREVGRDLAADSSGRCGLLARRHDLPRGGRRDRGENSGPADLPALDVTNRASLPARVRYIVGPDRNIGSCDGVAKARLQPLGAAANGFRPAPGNEDEPRCIGRGAHRCSHACRAPHGFSTCDRCLPRGVPVTFRCDAGDLLAGGQDDRRINRSRPPTSQSSPARSKLHLRRPKDDVQLFLYSWS
jgi:hypothetical protein